jgi:hypothetical protein
MIECRERFVGWIVVADVEGPQVAGSRRRWRVGCHFEGMVADGIRAPANRLVSGVAPDSSAERA